MRFRDRFGAIKWQLVIQLVATTAALAGVIGGIVTLRAQGTQLAKQTALLGSSTASGVTAHLLDMDQLLVANPEMRPYFLSGTPLDGLSATDRAKALAIADYRIDVFDAFFAQSNYVPDLGPTTPTGMEWAAYIGDSFHNSPAMCEEIRGAAGWHKRFADFVLNFAKLCG